MQDKKQMQEPKDEVLLKYANSIIATLRDPFLVLDGNLRVISANQAFYDSFEVAEKDTIGRGLLDLGNRQWDIPVLLQLLKEIIPEKKSVKDYEVEHKFERIGRHVMILNACQVRVPKKIAATIAAMAIGASAQGEVDEEDQEEELILLTIEDITERKHLQEELQESEERFRQAFETSRDGLLLIHKKEGNILNSNASAQKLLGYSKVEFLTEKLWEIGVTKDGQDFEEMMLKLAVDGVVYYEDAKVKTKEGQSISADIFLVDKTKVLQCNIRDITKRKKAEESLQKGKEDAETACKAKSEFLNNIAHDFRTPIHAILGFSAFFQSVQFTEKQREYANIINEKSKGLLILVEDLLDVSRLESGKLELRSIEFDLLKSVQNAVEMGRSELMGKDVKLVCSLEDSFPRVKGDEFRFNQILTNLIGNAIKYTDKGEIIVKIISEWESSSEGKCRVMVSVQDTGLGIPKDKHARIFEAYTRFQEFNGSKERGGVGLGLYITKTLTELMGGTIRVVSQEGVGSEFIVTLDFDLVG